ncbi:MAG: VOC family protein, partial [Mesorhizobium sp.]
MTENTPASPHPLDHLVLPTASLDVARARLTLLGF